MKNKKKGTKEFPRISIFRSNKEIYVQIIDDYNNTTLTSYSSLKIKKKKKVTKTEIAKKVGEKIAKNMLKKNIKKAFFDRKGYIYHGRIKALINTMRKNKIKI